jgi:hypothetical protein
MTHISRPFQIALAALVLFLAVWFVALRGHSSGVETSGSSSSSGGTSAASTPSSSSSSSAQSAPGGGTPASKGGVYHGSAPGVEGLSRAIQRARGAVAQSQQNAKRQDSSQSSGSAGHSQVQQGQTQAAQGQTQGAHKPSSQAQQQTQTSQSRSSQRSAGASKQSSQAHSPQQSRSTNGVPSMQAVVEGELKHGKLVAVLFWNPKGAVDVTVRRQLRAAGRAQHGTLAVHIARSREVGLFGSFTRTVQVYSTPTILLVNRHGETSSLTGLADAFSIEQAIKEVKRAK